MDHDLVGASWESNSRGMVRSKPDSGAGWCRATTMPRSLRLPPEIFDLIVDQLHDEQVTLKACCLVSKSWIPRIRRHLFACVSFDTLLHPFALWMKAFPDPSNSPAHHTRSLTIHRFQDATTTDADVASYFRTFHNVVRLHFKFLIWTNHENPLISFYGFSHTVRSLRLSHTSFEVFDLVCSFPLLEDLALVNFRPGSGTAEWSAPSTSPNLTGSIDLSSMGGIRLAIRRLLDFPNGLRFAEITASCLVRDLEPMTDLVSRCSGTLEYLSLYCFPSGEFPPARLHGRSTPYHCSWT